MTLKKALCLTLALLVAIFVMASCSDDEVPTITGIEIVEGSVATSYQVGDEIDTTGIKVKVTYSDESTTEVGADKLTITPLATDAAGTYTLKVEYEGFSDTVELTVTAKPDDGNGGGEEDRVVLGIKVKEKTIPSSYEIGEEIDLSGMILILKYGRNDEEELPYMVNGVANPDVQVTLPSTTSVGQFNIEVTYLGKTYKDYYITVNDSVVSVTLDDGGRSYDFFVTAAPDLSDLKVKVTHASGKSYTRGTENGVKYYTIDADKERRYNYLDTATPTANGEYRTFYVTYENKTIAVPYTVTTDVILSSMTVKEGTLKTTYIPGDTLQSMDSLVMNLFYTDGVIKEIPAFIDSTDAEGNPIRVKNPALTVTGYDAIDVTTSGEYFLGVTYEAYEDGLLVESATARVSVKVAAISVIEVLGIPASLKYGAAFDLSALTVNVLYNDGVTVKTFSADKIKINEELEDGENVLDYVLLSHEVDTKKIGSHIITVSYTDETDEIVLTVLAPTEPDTDGDDNLLPDVSITGSAEE